MYSGNYLETGNLGHEVINLFKSDNGNHYIYSMSAGDYDTKSHDNSIKKVILVRNVDCDNSTEYDKHITNNYTKSKQIGGY